MIESSSAWLVIGFLVIHDVGISLVSVHYRKKYEEGKLK